MPENADRTLPSNPTTPQTPVKSIAQVYFPANNRTLSYYNDLFDLQAGDIVFVEGKFEGLRGRVVSVSHAFKIKLSDYKRVISRADTHISGEFAAAGSHFITFAPDALPYEKALSWYKAPRKPEDEYITNSNSQRYALNDLKNLPIQAETADRGIDYYHENKVRYLCLSGGRGRAIVEGTRAYEVEFIYDQEGVGGLLCDCYCSGLCKHAFAALLQLRETLEATAKINGACKETPVYFASVSKAALFLHALSDKSEGRIIIDC